MQENKQPSVFLFVVIMCLISGGILAFLNTSLKEKHVQNELLFNKKAILKSVESYLETPVDGLSDEEVESIFSDMDQIVVDYEGNLMSREEVIASGYSGGMAQNVELSKEEKKPMESRIFPLFIYKNKKGNAIYIASVRGNGLWDKIWGKIALEDDFNTIAGVSFDHQGETPGLGAEIKDNVKFQEQFRGKQLYDGLEYVSVLVRKGGAREENIDYEVDGITGATITSDGVSEMMYSGLKYYEPYFKSLK